MERATEADTKTLILDAAEQSFANVGFAAASLRQIISEAGVNLAAVHYHYGSKEALIEAVFERRIGPLNAERLQLLEAAEAAAGKKAPALEALIEALVGPALRMANDPKMGGSVVMRLFGRTLAEPSDQLQQMLGKQFGHVAQRFTRAFQRALPDLPESVVLWRFHFMIGSMAHVMTCPVKLKDVSHGLCDPADTETVVKQLVAFLAAGLRAKSPEKGRK